MKYIKKLIRNSKRALNQQVIKKKQEIVKYAPRLTGIQAILLRDTSLNKTLITFLLKEKGNDLDILGRYCRCNSDCLRIG